MSFSEMLDILRKKEGKKIVFVRCGTFYIAIAEDAVMLHEILGLKCTCFKNYECKVGVPINAIAKYVKELEKKKYAYIVYDFNKEKTELVKQYENEGKYHYLTDKNINCLKCKGISKYKEDEYIKAVIKLIDKE